MSEAITKECPFCAETIKAAALVCRFCGRDLPPSVMPSAPALPLAPPSRPPSSAIQNLNAQRAPEIQNAEVLDLLTSLVDKSLVVYDSQGGEGRYRLLETVRQYAGDRLPAGGAEGRAPAEGGSWGPGPGREAAAVRERHRDWFLALAEEAAAGESQGAWLDRREREHDNLRAALAWTETHGPGEVGLRLGHALGWFWEVRGYWTEGREHLARLLALPGAEARTAARARALQSAGALARLEGDHEAARALYEESLAIFREVGDQRGAANSLVGLGQAVEAGGDPGAAGTLFEKSLAAFRELGDQGGIALSLNNLGHVALDQGAYGAARALLEESLAIFQERRDQYGIAWSLCALGWVAFKQGDYEAARAFNEEGLAIFRALGNREGTAWTLMNMGGLARERREYGAARARFEECLVILGELGLKGGIVWGLEGLAVVVAAQGQPETAARLFGAAEALCEAIGTPLPRANQAENDRCTAAIRAALGENAFAAAWAAGRVLSLDEACAVALQEPAFVDPMIPP